MPQSEYIVSNSTVVKTSTTSEGWVDGFSKLDKDARRTWLANHYAYSAVGLTSTYASFDHGDAAVQDKLDSFAENSVANFVLPLGIVPNLLVDGKLYAVPLAIEESSVVAAASAAAKYWAKRGGIRTTVVGTVKVGQLFFTWAGEEAKLRAALPIIEQELRTASAEHTQNMEARGGGVLDVTLHSFGELPQTYELRGRFETCDSMGANFINTVLEAWGGALSQAFATAKLEASAPEVLMAILSNYTPECVVRAEVSCAIEDLGAGAGGYSAAELADRFCQAVRLAEESPSRAVTHNKGIFNGVDAVVIATGNDFRAVEACGHAYAARDGQYRSLSHCSLKDGVFKFWLELPLALGSIGGLTKAHPLAAASLQVLGQPDAQQLMRVVAATGLAQNFAAVRSLVTTGIQAGHMRMHLQNVLTQLNASIDQRATAVRHFATRPVSFAAVRTWLAKQDSQSATQNSPSAPATQAAAAAPIGSIEDASPAERFQNAVLRPTLKQLHPRLVEAWHRYAEEHKGTFYKLNRPEQRDYLRHAFNTNRALRAFYLGLVTASFTTTQWQDFRTDERELARRIYTMTVERLLDAVFEA